LIAAPENFNPGLRLPPESPELPPNRVQLHLLVSRLF